LTSGSESPLTCLLNPESLTQRRVAGVQQRRAAGGLLTGAGLSDDPLLFTGGGRTELDLDLLFDVSLSESPVEGNDVRNMTRRLWNLAENREEGGERGRPQVVRFMWGKSWNIPGVVISVAERLEHFDADGVPRRSWLRLRMLRVSEDSADEGAARAVSAAELPVVTPEGLQEANVHQVTGGVPEAEGALPEVGSEDLPLSADDLIDQALADTSVDAQIESAWGDLSAAGRMIDELLASLAGSEGEGDEGQAPSEAGAAAEEASTEGQASADEGPSADGGPSAESQASSRAAAAQELRVGMDEVQAVQAQVDGAPRSRLVGALTEAGAVLSSGWERMRAAASALLDQAPEAAEADRESGRPSLRQRLSAALDRVSAAGRKVRAAARRAAAAIKARAVVVIAAATQHVQGVAQGLGETAARVAAAGSALGARHAEAATQAWETVRGVAAEIGEAARSVVTSGKAFASDKLGPAVSRLAAAANRLWLEGQAAAARGIRRAVEGLSRAMRQAAAGAEAMAAASSAKARALVEGAVERIRARLRDLSAGRENQAALAVRRELAAVSAAAGTMGVVSPAGAAAPARATAPDDQSAPKDALIEQVDAARGLVEVPDALAQPGAAQHLLEALDGIVETARSRERDEAENDAQALASAAAADLPPSPRPDLARTTVGVGDRLDQLAYRYYRDPALWRLLAAVNGIDHPLRVRAGSLLRVPPASALRTKS
jgi:hypothetical protein